MWSRRSRRFYFGFPPFGFYFQGFKPFPSQKEYLDMLEEYKKNLEEELKEVEREIEKQKRVSSYLQTSLNADGRGTINIEASMNFSGDA